MTKKTVSDAITNISAEYIEKAADYTATKKAHRTVWAKWAAIAACLAVVAALGIGVFQRSRTDIAALDNGTKIVFVKSKAAASSIQLDADVTTRPLTEQELSALFPGLPATGYAVYGGSEGFLGIEGNIGNAKMVIAAKNIPLLDTKIEGTEESTTVNGTSVVAGYFVTNRNSVGEQNAIYYAAFRLGDCTVYVENAGNKSESERVKTDLAAIIQEMTGHGALNLNAIEASDSEK